MADALSTATPKRFYKTVTVAPQESGWQIELDGRTPKTPARKPLVLPTRSLAEALAAEWDAQTDRLDLPRMTLTRLSNVALDRTPLTRSEMTEEVARYAASDLLCYLAAHPAELQARQDAVFRPWREWAGHTHGVRLMPTTGLMPQPQPPVSLAAAKAYASAKDDFMLTGLALGLSLFGSAVLAMAVADGELSASGAFDISRTDEVWQTEQWGEDLEAAAVTAGQRREVEALGDWFAGLKGKTR